MAGAAELLCVFLIIVPAFGFWIWMLVDCATNEPSTGNDKLIWILIILLAHVFGALIYYFSRRPKRIAEIGH